MLTTKRRKGIATLTSVSTALSGEGVKRALNEALNSSDPASPAKVSKS